ncbi:MAG TPA: alpha/beta fold hydrolase [Gammaproteobacteria bacterium]|nr:alpha/beta fold hydrolase [Gammaproteobacteria bacterium]
MPELHYTKSGSGPALLILHGLFGSGKNWHSHMRRFAESFAVYSVDLRNHGQSFHADEMNYPSMAADVAQLIAQLELRDCRILGHSMGGKVAMTLAIQHPALLSRMIVADIAPVAYQHDYDDLIEPILALDLDSFASRTQIDHALRPSIPEDQLRAFLLQNLFRETDGWRWRVNWPIIQRDMDELTGFAPLPGDWVGSQPTLFIRGAKSDYVGSSEIEVIEHHFSDARIATIDGAGHWLHAEKPLEFSRLALDFLLH